jgi:dCMP deaminase
MPSQRKLDELYLDIAERVSQMSHGRRLKVGAVVTKGRNIISYGWNGMPAGMDNNCEIENADGTLSTRPEVVHAEDNALRKLQEANTDGQLDGATLYCTDSPCPHCADLYIDSKIARVVYRKQYRLLDGVERCRACGIEVEHIPGESDDSKPASA